MTEELNVKFDYSVDEAVASQFEFLRTTKEGRSWRRREQWRFAISLVLVVACWFFFFSSDRSTSNVIGVVVIVAIVVTVGTILFGLYYDHSGRNRTRRLLVERLGPGPYACSIEIRPEGLWIAQPSVEQTFPWRDVKRIEDTADGIAVLFVGGRVLARTRGFSTQAHRESFLASLQRHLSAAGIGLSAPSNSRLHRT